MFLSLAKSGILQAWTEDLRERTTFGSPRKHGEQQKIRRKTFETRRKGVSGGKIVINERQLPAFSDASFFKGVGNATLSNETTSED
jgi:hypothetical protein